MSRFQTTRWSLISMASQAEPARARPALEQLCRAYRPPVLAYIRRSGHAAGDVEDLAQAFFLRFLERGWYGSADPGRGRFRALLLASLRNFLADQARQARPARANPDLLETLPDPQGTPEQAFHRAWLGTVLLRATHRLELEWEAAGKAECFRQLAPMLGERLDPAELRHLAETVGIRANTLSVQLHRMRRRLRQLVRLELLNTVDGSDALATELAELRAVLDADG